MTLLILVNSSGLTVDMHFCQDKFKRLNIFGKAKTCSEVAACMLKCGKQVKSCHSASSTCDLSSKDHKGCCQNASFDLDLEFDYFTAIAIDNETPLLDLVLICSELKCFDRLEKRPSVLNPLYVPPLLIQDISVLYDRFII